MEVFIRCLGVLLLAEEFAVVGDPYC